MHTWIQYVRTGASEIELKPPSGYNLYKIVPCGDIGVYFVYLDFRPKYLS